MDPEAPDLCYLSRRDGYDLVLRQDVDAGDLGDAVDKILDQEIDDAEIRYDEDMEGLYGYDEDQDIVKKRQTPLHRYTVERNGDTMEVWFQEVRGRAGRLGFEYASEEWEDEAAGVMLRVHAWAESRDAERGEQI
jgi:hypothetical protein